jgi:diguanylate cyclase (GGDEF)-like protein/PAS domain S-box-containing protein
MKPKKNKNSTVEILIAEDSPTQAERLQGLLEGHGYAAVLAADGRQALVLARQHRPSLVISDVLMPELDGYDLCKAIKADEKLKDIPVMLVTTLSDPQDVIRGLECGADNFIRKPYDERDLLSRIDYLLMNLELRKSQKMQLGLEINLGGHKHFITAERQQILDLLVSTYEQAVLVNNELMLREKQLAHSNQVLNGLFRIAEGLNRAVNEHEVAETALERALELPGIQAGWISLREGECNFRVAAAHNLPPGLASPGALEGDCACRRRLLSGELDAVTNVIECERLAKAKGDAHGLHWHASVPLWLGEGRALGVMNLVGNGDKLFDEEELKVLHGVGNQVAVALERAKLHEHLGMLVEERTAKLATEITQRIRVQQEQARLVAIVEATPDFVGTADLDGRPIFTNRAGRRMLGFEPGQDLPVTSIAETHPEWAAKRVREEGIPHAIEHGSWSGETAFLRTDGRETPVSQVIIAHRGADGAVEYLSTVARDITEHKAQEARIMRLNRIYSVLSGINTTIVRVHERQELFVEACRIAVEHGRFRMAWIGLLDPEGVKVTPMTKAGFEEGYLDQITLSANEDAPDGCVLVAQALSEKTPIVCNDIGTDPRMARWRAEALRRGYRSIVVFPLLPGDKPVGVFVLYAAETGFFDTEEMKLLVEVARDVSFALENIEKEERLNYLAYYDVLTGLPNRTLFYDRLDQRLHASKNDDTTLAVLAIDLERFRTINETLGRHAGDALLKQVAERLRAAGLDADHLARISADGFAAVLPDLRKEADVAYILEGRIHDTLSRPFALGGEKLHISARFGIALFPADGTDADALFRNAEAALKKAKLSGDRYLFYTPELNARVAEKLSLENKLHRALEQEQLVLYYQPKVNLESGQISGLEALLRWNDPETGLVPPLKFIPLLEETGMILDVGRWALAQAVSDSRAWQTQGLRSPRIAVNVSPLQLHQKDFVGTIEHVMSDARDMAGGLEIEITESLLMQDIEANIMKLRTIRDMDIEIAVDDFGTGYSSLSYIARLPLNTLKIDRAFIMAMVNSPDDLSIVATIISLAHSLNLKVVAEGVETEEQAKLLRQLKCDEIQGYLFSPAVPAVQIGQFLREKKSLPG